MGKGFEIEYFSDIGLGPRFRVDVESGFITKDEVFQTGEGPLADWEKPYPGNFDEGKINTEAAQKAYQDIVASGLEPGQFYMSEDENGRGFRIQVHGEDSYEAQIDEVDERYIEQAIEGLEDVF